MLPIKNLIELVVKSLGRGLFVLKLTAIQARSQVPRSRSVAVPPAQPSHWPAWSHPAIKIVAMTANRSHAMATISPAKGHYPATLRECPSRAVISVSGSHRTCGVAGLRPGAPTAGGGGGEVLLTRMSGLTVSSLVAWILVMSAASLSTLWRTAARLRDMAAS